MSELRNKVAVVTGGNSGIGLATAKLFAERGAKVAVSGRDPKTLEAANKHLGPAGLAIRADVSNVAEIKHFLATVNQKLGKIDILFANAGVARFAPLNMVDEKLYDELFGINVKGVFFTIQEALPYLNDNASIILNTSVADQKGLPNSSVYSATKAALRSFARTLGGELASRGIRVNAISPGPIETPLFGRMGLSKEQVDEFGRMVIGQVPMKRFGSPEEVASAALFLAGTQSSYITGVELNVDGGMGQI